ncbi:hypothetical protein LOCC1_G007583 [Lachnellula occidentalis]|uniref:MARVEL domain-containing protein n=1 Tax=Lachnellula occidentalis TaxID=215460 RepID=A0A8H8RQT7_9HELO|nr:hypothetical protein LOCC1_G007583 [Lachnellula occidentalis]
MGFGGVALKSVSFFLRIIEFCCAAIILGIFSYFLAVLSNHDLGISTYVKAVEGISGAGVLYTIFALCLVCCLGGIAFFSFLGMVLDLAFTGAFIYIAYATRHGANSCSGIVNTPLGTGNAGTNERISNGSGGSVHLPQLHTACKLNTACFAVSIIAAVFFFLSIFMELALARHHKREKAYGPSPNNGYTAGTPKRKFWQRKPKNRDAEFGEKSDALPAHVTPADMSRQSYGTESTAVGVEPAYNKYGPPSATGGLAGQNQTGGVVNHGGWQTTTTHVPGRAQELPGNNPPMRY